MKWFKVLCAVVLSFSLSQAAVLAAPQQPHASSTTLKAVFYSESLQKEMNVNVYLPPNYGAQDKYPVLYVLHSYKLNEDHWFKALQVVKKADELISSGKIEPMIIVAPKIDNSFGVNSADRTGYMEGSGKPGDEGVLQTGKYEDYLTKDVVNFVDTHFNTMKSRTGRYIGGTSMGGFAALHIGLRHPNLYSKIGGHAPALFVGPMWDVLEKMIYPTDATRQENDPLALAASQKLNKVSIYLDCGEQDDFKEATKKLRDTLNVQKTKSFEFHSTPGGKHDDAYWSSQMENYLLFYGGMDRE
ncbi:alpha/beta hydrolase [Paenibacillus guangzhouensis]|uniref:alpha/beta hydrolase n=1 Tax=Paenibacillus guangzhouensis TaxID=1473112 RepID=UPI00126776AD|nr:alpha/beta hydrolase-fold protein [Paenibacillus guangzhouensis]